MPHYGSHHGSLPPPPGPEGASRPGLSRGVREAASGEKAGATAAGSGLQRALPVHLADEEWPQLLDVLRRLLGLPHLLDALGERGQVLPDQADDEFIVVLV